MPSCQKDQVQLFPFPSSHSPHRRANTNFFLGLDSPSQHTHFEDWLFNAAVVERLPHPVLGWQTQSCSPPPQLLPRRGTTALLLQLQNNTLSPGFCSRQKYQVKVQREPERFMYPIPTRISDSSIQKCIQLSQKIYLHHEKIPCFEFCLSSFKHTEALAQVILEKQALNISLAAREIGHQRSHTILSVKKV